ARANGHAAAVFVESHIMTAVDTKLDQIREARLKGYEGDACGECGNFTLVRNGTCLKCTTSGSTSGCSQNSRFGRRGIDHWRRAAHLPRAPRAQPGPAPFSCLRG